MNSRTFLISEKKTLFGQKLDLIDTQQQKIVALEGENVNKYELIKMRMLDIERYSSILFLIFYRLAASDPWDAVLKVIKNQMGFPINDVDLAACHFLAGAGRRPIVQIYLSSSSQFGLEL